MTADATVQVWVAAQAGQGPHLVVPYVQTVQVKRLQYRIELVNREGKSSARIRQSGELTTIPGEPIELSALNVGPRATDRCSITVDLSEEGATIGTYSFDCAGTPLQPHADGGPDGNRKRSRPDGDSAPSR